MEVIGGTLNAEYYEFGDLNIEGLKLQNTPTITELSNGLFDLAVDTGSLITLSSTTLNANPSKTFDNVGFTATTGISGFNINLVGETTNAWRITNNYGNIGGESFDIDGIDACGSIRFDNSACLLTEQTQVRWRADDGGEGAPDSEWFDQSFDFRTSVRVLNNDNQAYASTAVKVIIPYDSAMQSDFEDLRFTGDDGQTAVPFWLERYTASSEAQVWVLLPTLPASSQAVVYMYYGSTTASLASDGAATFGAFDDYEDNNITEYSGDTTLFTTVTSPVYGGTYALRPSNTSGRTTDGIFRFDDTVAQGQIIRYMQYVDTTIGAGSGDEPCTLFGVQSPGTTNQNYAVCLEQFGTDRISISENVTDNDTSGTVLASSTVTYSTGWYEVEIDWRTNNTMTAALYNAAGTLVASTTATDSSYTSGGYGYTFWFQNGAWDSFTARPRVATAPDVFLGAKQANGGANWISLQNSAGSAVPNDVVRLRVAIENGGLDVTGQQYRLEYAAKAAAPTCESVSSGSYVAVPNQASCGSSPVCMQTSSFVSNGAVTTDLLLNTDGTFSAGAIVTSPQNETAGLDVNQDYYTELEYVLTPTVNATDNYCFRVTNAGTTLDFYSKIAELGLQFDPTFGAISLNGGLPISLVPGTTTAVTVLGTVTDFNGTSDITNATATIYRSGAGAACTANNNNCYIASTENSMCAFTNCAGNSCDLSCTVDIFFHADPTDADTYEGEEWLAFAEVEDFSNGYDFASAPGVELNTLRALSVDSLINYGSLAADSDTGSFNPTTTVTNLGNVPINIDIEGNDLTDGASSQITADNQKVATSTFTYNACISCQQLSTSTPVTLGINLSKPSTVSPPVETEVYWGIAVPFTASNAAHTGTNIFTPISVNQSVMILTMNKVQKLLTLILVITLQLATLPTSLLAQSSATPPEISDVQVTGVTDSAMTITWETDEDADSSVNYGLQPDLGIVRIPVPDRTSHSITLDNLEPGRTYYFRVISADEDGNQGISADYKVEMSGTPQTGDGPGQGESSSDTTSSTQTPSVQEIVEQINEITNPQQLQEILQETVEAIQGITDDLTIIGPPTVIPETTTALISWTTDREASSEVQFSPSASFNGGTYAFSQKSTGDVTTDHEIRIIGLEPFTEYSFKVLSTDASGITGESRNFTFMTKASLPEIRNLRVLKVEENAATLAWDTTVPAKALIEYQDQTTGAQNSVGRPTLATSHQMRLADLTLGTRYVAFVISENSGGDRVRSQPIQFITVRDIAPPIISNVTNESTLFPGSESRIQTIVEWATDEAASCEMTYREGVAGGTEPTVREKEALEYNTSHVEVIVDFAPATVYQFWLNCDDEAGNTVQSENFVLFTPIQEKNIIDLILENFQSTFGWVKNIGGGGQAD